jgi:hypothetical protein
VNKRSFGTGFVLCFFGGQCLRVCSEPSREDSTELGCFIRVQLNRAVSCLSSTGLLVGVPHRCQCISGVASFWLTEIKTVSTEGLAADFVLIL